MDKELKIMLIELLVDTLEKGEETISIGDLENFFPEEIEKAKELAKTTKYPKTVEWKEG